MMMMTGKNYLFITLLQDESLADVVGGFAPFIVIAIIFGMFFLVRMFCAWMFRINDVIDELKQVNRKLTKIEKQLNLLVIIYQEVVLSKNIQGYKSP